MKSHPGAFLVLLLLAATSQVLPAQDDNIERWATFSKSVTPELKDRQPVETRRLAIRRFATEDYREAGQFLIKLLANRRTPHALKLEASTVLKNYQSKEIRALVDTSVKQSRGGNRYLLSAYIGHGDPDSLAFLLDLVKNADSPGIKALAIDVIANLPAAQVSSGYTTALIEWMKNEDTFHGIRLAAAKALGAIPDKQGVPALISQLNDPLLMTEARDSLLRLTAEEHWMDQKGWETWWKQIEATLEPKPLEQAVFLKKRDELLNKFGDGNNAAEFYGRKLEGKNVLFLLDNSGSMLFENRIDQLKSELERMISKLDERFQFGFVVFPKASFPGRDFDRATEKYREKALEFVEDMDPQGGTPMVEAIEYAFRRVVAKRNVDTIYLLSDGQPSDLDGKDLASLMLEFNEIYGVKVNTIFIGEDPVAEALMKQVAEDSGGNFFQAQ